MGMYNVRIPNTHSSIKNSTIPTVCIFYWELPVIRVLSESHYEFIYLLSLSASKHEYFLHMYSPLFLTTHYYYHQKSRCDENITNNFHLAKEGTYFQLLIETSKFKSWGDKKCMFSPHETLSHRYSSRGWQRSLKFPDGIVSMSTAIKLF